MPSSFTPELDVVDTKSYQVIARVPQASPFSPNLAVSRDGNEVWFTLKDSGKTHGTRVYVGLENQDAVVALDALTNTVLATIPVGQQPQALVYVFRAVPVSAGTTNLMPLGDAGHAAHLTLIAPEGRGSPAQATVSVNALGLVDLLQIAASGLKPGQTYRLWLVTSRTAPFGQKEELVSFKTNLAGAQIAQVIGPFRQALTSKSEGTAEPAPPRFLLLTPADSEVPELIQKAP